MAFQISHIKTVLLATSILSAGFAGAAFAQSDSAIESVVVTGTRLSSGFVTPTPVTAVGAEQLLQRAPSTISDVVNELPMMRQTTGNTQAPRGNGSGGQNLVDLRGLGATRTLILLDGNRFVPTSLNGATDVNVIPTNLIGRVDVVTGGASAAYGSDAVSGVVNFVVKQHIDGIQASMQYGESERGDNIEPAFSVAAGGDFFNDRLHVIGGGDFSNNHGVGTIYSRPDYYGTEQGCLVTNPATRAANVPAVSLVTNCTWSTQAAGSVIVSGRTATGGTNTALNNIAFGTGGVPYQFQTGTVLGTLMYGGLPNPEDPHASPNGNWLLEAPHKRYTALGKITYDLTDDISVYAMYNYGHNEQRGLSTFHQETNIKINSDNPFIPASIKAAMATNGITQLLVGKQEEALGGYQFYQKNTTSRGAVGIKGTVFGDWSWDAYYTHGETPQDTPLLSNVLEGNYLAAIYAVTDPKTGQAVCGPTATNPNFGTGQIGAGRETQVSAGCQPFNIFGPSVNVFQGNGRGYAAVNVNPSIVNNPSASLASVNYIAHTTASGSYYQQDVVAANIHGDPFELWAGPVSMALGIEHRREGGRTFTDFEGLNNYSLSNNGSSFSGAFQVTEGYVELGIPLAKDVAWAQALDLDIAVRDTGYEAGNRMTYKVGVNYSPVDWLRFRATRSRDVREPSIQELFATISQGITATFNSKVTGKSGPEYTISGGNPNLKPEVATSWTAGAVFTPNFGNILDGLKVSVDYYSVSIRGAIGSVSAANTDTFCATGLTFYCQFILPTGGPGGALAIKTQLANLNLEHTDGFDFEVAYPAPIDSLGLPGDLNVRWLSTFVNAKSVTTAVSTTQLAGSGVGGGIAKWISNLNLNYGLGASTTDVTVRFTGDLLADATLVGPGQPGYSPTLSNSTNINQYPSSYYVDLSEQYRLGEVLGGDMSIFFNVKNLLDKSEPALGLIAFVTGGDPYDKIGRTYKLGLRVNF